MKVTQRIPTETYAYLEFEKDYETIGEAMAEHTELCSSYSAPGIPDHQWPSIRNKMFRTGEFDPNIEGLSKAQRYFINQCKLAIRANEKDDEPVIN